MRARHLALVAGALLCAMPVAAQRAVGSRTVAPILRSLTIRGNRSIPTDQLKAAIVSEASHCRSGIMLPLCPFDFGLLDLTRRLDRAELERDALRLRVFYWRRGWRAAQVEPVVTPSGDGVAARLEVTEGPVTSIGTIDFAGLDSLFSARERRQLLETRIGAPLDLVKLDSAARRFTRALDQRGFGDAVVLAEAIADTTSPRARVRFEVRNLYRTFVEVLRVEGTEFYDPRLVANTMRLKPGQPYTRARLAEAQRSLYEVGFFKRGVVRVDSGSRRDLKVLVATVEEVPVHAVKLTGGVSTTDFVQLDARYSNANFRNSAGQLSVQGTVSNLLAPQLNGTLPFNNVLPGGTPDSLRFLQPTFQANVDVRRRWLKDPRNQTGVGVFAYRRSAPGVFTDQGGGAAATFTRDVSRGLPLSGTYRFELTNVQAADVYFCANFGVCDASSRSVLQGTQRLAPLALTANMDRRDDPLSATRGFTWRSELEIADRFTGSSIWYSRAEVEGAYYRPVSDRMVLAIHGRAGMVVARRNPALGSTGAVIHPRKRFYAGGAQSVRGYGENQLGPRVLAIPRLNLQPPVARYDSIVAGTLGRDRRIPCPPTTVLVDCPVNATTAGGVETSNFIDGDFSPKPLGGDQLVEGSLEARYRVAGPITLAFFVDMAVLRSRESVAGASLQTSVTAVTPGVGVRYKSPVGPVRLDIGVNPKRSESLSVITESGTWDSEVVGGTAQWVLRTPGLATLAQPRLFNPSTGTGLSGILNRVTLHLSIGEAF